MDRGKGSLPCLHSAKDDREGLLTYLPSGRDNRLPVMSRVKGLSAVFV